MPTNSDGLCSVCANIDLKEYFRREIHVQWTDSVSVRPNEDALRLGGLEDIDQRSESCSFCWLVIETICKSRYPPHWATRQGLLDDYRAEGINCDCLLFSYLYAENRSPSESPFQYRDLQRAYRIGIAVRGVRASIDEPEVVFLDHVGDIQLSATSAAQNGMPRLCHGRVLNSERVDMGMARDWLSECETHHNQKCAFPDMATAESASPAGPQDLLVVDVLLMNLCRMPHGSRYITLSYCWPKGNTFVTTKSNVTELYIPGALRDNEERTIPAIQDAIQCVSELGERYLWIDALCIIQDDEQQKSSQIQQMDQVYSCSLLTLIHAPPSPIDHAEGYKGFVGYRKGSRITKQRTYHVGGMELLIPLPGVDYVIKGSLWTTRAWTFQEERLSRRRLYFTETQLYFQCSCAVFCEDSVGEGIDPSAFIFPGTNLWNSSGLHSSFQDRSQVTTTLLPRNFVDDPVEAVDAYSRSLHQFRTRQMSDSRDIIASFEGILSVFRKSLKTDFWFGLPEKYLDETLLWTETGPSLRRNVSINSLSDMTFPSWSWAGWDTTVELGFYICGPIYPEVAWFVINRDGEGTQLVTHGSNDPSPHVRVTSSGRNFCFPGPPDNFLKTVQHQAILSNSKKREFLRFLACWTCVVSFGIGDEDVGPTWKSGEQLPVIDNVGQWAGSVFMGNGWKDNTKGNSRTFEFMLLSRSRSSSLNEDLKYHDVNLFTPREWCFLNVMLIQREGDRAQRVGIGVIHEDAWVEANPVPMLIKLE